MSGSSSGMLIAAALAVSSCSIGFGVVDIEVTAARAGAPAGDTAAAYATIEANGRDDRLVGARTAVAHAVELHQTVIEADGTATMRQVEAIDLPAGDTVLLEPASYHIMLVGVDPLQAGDRVEITLLFEEMAPMSVEFVVVDPGDTLGYHDHGR